MGGNANLDSHFIGSAVYIPETDVGAAIPRWLVIYGQQRITTMTLLLLALRNRILRDDALVDVAAQTPQTPEELARSRAFNRDSAGGKTGRAILDAVAAALALPKDQWPTLPDQDDAPQGRQPVANLLRVLLKIKCNEHDVAPKLIAS